MNSLILRVTTRFLFPLMLLFSVFLLLRGHNDPGGGFAGGLVAAAAYVLYAIAFDPLAARRALRVEPRILLGTGLLLALSSGLVGLFGGKPFLESFWWFELEMAPRTKISVGTPLLFDMGVYLAVIGATLLILLSLLEE